MQIYEELVHIEKVAETESQCQTTNSIQSCSYDCYVGALKKKKKCNKIWKVVSLEGMIHQCQQTLYLFGRHRFPEVHIPKVWVADMLENIAMEYDNNIKCHTFSQLLIRSRRLINMDKAQIVNFRTKTKRIITHGY